MPGTDMLDNFMQSLRSALPDTMLEDTIVMAITGISVFWILATMILFALIVVWGRKAIMLASLTSRAESPLTSE